MRLLEQLRAGPILARGVCPGYLDEAAGLLDEAVPIQVDNVARFYYEVSPQAIWNMDTDFPNVAPPWPVSFWEFRSPRWINRQGRHEPPPGEHAGDMGVLLWARPWEAVSLHEHAVHVVWSHCQARLVHEQNAAIATHLRTLGPAGVWASLGAARQAAALADLERQRQDFLDMDGGWWCQAWVFGRVERTPPCFVAGYAFPVNASGGFVEPPRHPGNYIYAVDAPLWSVDYAVELHAKGIEPMHVPWLATAFCHCKNVVIRDDAPPAKLAAAQLKRHGVPKITYKTLEIQPMLGILQTEGGMGHGNSAQKALHICRGHFMDYREGRGLFGKHHGLYWKDMHVRGKNRQGVVIKDYAVTAPVEA